MSILIRYRVLRAMPLATLAPFNDDHINKRPQQCQLK